MRHDPWDVDPVFSLHRSGVPRAVTKVSFTSFGRVSPEWEAGGGQEGEFTPASCPALGRRSGQNLAAITSSLERERADKLKQTVWISEAGRLYRSVY